MIKVVSDGDCLFHALASFHGGDGGALRIDVADFLEQEAVNQEGFEAEWLDEAEKLRERYHCLQSDDGDQGRSAYPTGRWVGDKILRWPKRHLHLPRKNRGLLKVHQMDGGPISISQQFVGLTFVFLDVNKMSSNKQGYPRQPLHQQQ